MNTKTPTEAGLKFIYQTDGEYAFLNEQNLLEFYVPNKHFSGSTIKYRNTKLEFTRSYNDSQMLAFRNGVKSIHNYGEQHPNFKYAYKIIQKLN